MAQHALSAGSIAQNHWILDSGATCHMCNNEAMFSDLQALQNPLNVTLGDGRDLHAVGRGNVVLTMNLPQDKTESYTLHDVLLVPDLAYNLVSVTAASKKGKMTTFSEMKCEIRDSKSKLVATGHRDGSLYCRVFTHAGSRNAPHKYCTRTVIRNTTHSICTREIN